jgi:ribonuclease Y
MDMTPVTYAIIGATAVVAIIIGYMIRKYLAEGKLKNAEILAKDILNDANKDAEAKKREAVLEAKEEVHSMRQELDREIKSRRGELAQQEKRLVQKEENLDRKQGGIEKKEDKIQRRMDEIENIRRKTDEAHDRQIVELERISSLTFEEARTMLLKNVEDEIRHETAMMIKNIEMEAKMDADKKARNIITLAIQRCAADHVAETTVSVVNLPNDEMKGRIIGREGRNIRAMETLTGIDLIIDDTPEAVVLSGFDPVRREIARLTLEKLIADGRIHPGRIEEMYEKAKKEVEEGIREEGEQATFDTGVTGIHPELIRLLGRLKYRTSYGQNVLKHSIEVALVASNMALELGADAQLAKRAGLLHDIGKAVDHEIEGTHVDIGVDLARKYKESPEVIHCIAAHHGDTEPQTVEAFLVQAADSISAARPGARRETLETYIKRLKKLEEIAEANDGVEKSFAIQAGREVRIMVKPERIDDAGSVQLSRNIVKQIESEMDYPGQIKVVVIRETRAVDYAK